jgi:aryl-alcohol dehydrogenase-like predicted oxidoreductase
MIALDALVRSEKVLYLGISDTPAWVVVKANAFAREKGLSQFVLYQGRWSISERDMERDIIPMCRDEGMALHIYGALGSGKYKTQEQLAAMASAGDQVFLFLFFLRYLFLTFFFLFFCF